MTPIRLCVSLPIVHWVEPKHTHTCINLHSLHDDDGGGATVRRQDGAAVLMRGPNHHNIFTVTEAESTGVSTLMVYT